MRVESKRKFFEMWEAGLLGNRTRLWRDPAEAHKWGRENNHLGIGFRELRQPGTAGSGKWEKVQWYRVLDTAARWRAEGRDFIMDDGAPDDKRLVQGEVIRTERGLEGYITTAKLPIREAKAAGLFKSFGYLATKVLLDRYMDPSSREDLDAIFELFPDAAVEFSCFSVNVGIIPGRNTLFWEVRDY